MKTHILKNRKRNESIQKPMYRHWFDIVNFFSGMSSIRASRFRFSVRLPSFLILSLYRYIFFWKFCGLTKMEMRKKKDRKLLSIQSRMRNWSPETFDLIWRNNNYTIKMWIENGICSAVFGNMVKKQKSLWSTEAEAIIHVPTTEERISHIIQRKSNNCDFSCKRFGMNIHSGRSPQRSPFYLNAIIQIKMSLNVISDGEWNSIRPFFPSDSLRVSFLRLSSSEHCSRLTIDYRW